MDYLQQLNDVQRKAVTHTAGPTLVIAGPGSGKTRVLTYRIAHLINTGVAPFEILALTFTNKAAKEMKERIEQVVGDRAKYIWAGTFHSLFARILRTEAEKIGFTKNFTIYDSDDTKSLITDVMKSLNLDPKTYNVNSVRQRISSAKMNIIPPRAYEQNKELLEQDRRGNRPHIHKVYTRYIQRCKQADAMDFDDLLYQMFILLYKNEDGVREKYQQKFKYVLVDEFQDTNQLQYGIIKKIVNYANSPRNLCVVGDDAQSIYAFRGATIQNILDLESDYKDLVTFKLEQNYRSTHHIVEAANDIITYNKKQIKKKIWSDKGEGQPIKVIKAVFDSEEGKRVAGLVTEYKMRYHLSNKDIAILYRTNSQSRIFEESLIRSGVKYKVYGGMSFYQRKEVKDLLAYLKLVINHKDDVALRRVINYPARGIGKTTLDKIGQLAEVHGVAMWDVILKSSNYGLGKGVVTKLRTFYVLMDKFIKYNQTHNAYETAYFILKNTKILDDLKKDRTEKGLERIENINALLDGIKDFVEDDELLEGQELVDKTLANYLQNVALITDLDSDDSSDDNVTLMSVHASKGLEFKTVFVVGLEENLFPSFMASKDAEGIDEERRLFYVAVTRAEAFLVLSYAEKRYKFGKMVMNEPSRFLKEISQNHLEEAAPVRARGGYTKSGVSGSFGKSRMAMTAKVDLSNFQPSPSKNVNTGQVVLHQRFGEGKVVNIDGNVGSRVATIFFSQIKQEKRIMLKFAKLQIL